MALNPNIFLEGSRQFSNNNSNLVKAIQYATAEYRRRQMLEDANLDKQRAAAMKPEAILAKANQYGADKLSPAERSAFNAYQQLRSADIGLDMAGNTYKKYRPIELSDNFAAITGDIKRSQDGQVGSNFSKIAGDMPAPIGESESIPGVSKRIASSPAVQLEKAKEYSKKSVQAEFDKQKESKSKLSAQNIISRMSDINDQLLEMGAIASEQQKPLDRLADMSRGFTIPMPLTDGLKLGRSAEALLDPRARALKAEYEKLQSSFLPFYAKASGLGAKSLDSEGERKSILSSFGDPYGLYEANKRQLENLTNLVGTSGANKTNADIRGNSASQESGSSSPYMEGQTATNPVTGQKVIFKGGKWQKM